MKTIFYSLVLFAMTLSAADLTGKWSGTYDVTISDGQTLKGRVYMVLTQSGSDLTGTIGPDEQQQSQITKGKVENERITFENQTEGPLMRFELRLVDEHIRGEGRGDMEGMKIQAKLEMARAE
jgi:hypothetical protein